MPNASHMTLAPEKMRKSIIVILLATVLLTTVTTFLVGHRYFEEQEHRAIANKLVLYLRSLNETLLQHQHLPFILTQDPRYSVDLNPTSVTPQTNKRLRQLAKQAKLEAIYLMDDKGLVLAASNAHEPHSFLGQNYGFRPYFQDALLGQRSDYFAIGATSGRPGYFVAEPVMYANGTQKGVIAIKLDISELQRSWESGTDTVVAVNSDGVIVLASNPDWLYRPISNLGKDIRQSIATSRQFGAKTLSPVKWQAIEKNRVRLADTNYLTASGDSDWREWTVHYLQPERIVLQQTLLATALIGGIIALLIGFATFLRSRRIELAYAASERQRSALIETNTRLERAQTELARSAKLAALGHLAASVTHELGQPISAFRNHLAAAEIGNEIRSPETVTNLNKLVARMESITGQFRYFARTHKDAKSTVELSAILKESQDLLKTEIVSANIEMTLSGLSEPIELLGHKVQLEQAFTNLIRNAVQAVGDEPDPKISIEVKHDANSVELHILDNGPGLADASLKKLQEPFFSTKPSGVGMGLGLAITTEIIKNHGGEITLGSPRNGAEFIVTLPFALKGALE